MDGSRFDAMTKTLATSRSRRSTVRALAAGAVAIGLGRLGLDQITAKKKKRKKKLKKNAFGCVNVGGKCRGKDANCCSGICQGKKPKQGKKDKSTCVAHDVLDCPAGADWCGSQPVYCGPDVFGICYQTTGQASFCAFPPTGLCQSCTKDGDCEPDFGPGAACVVCPGDCPATGTACYAPL